MEIEISNIVANSDVSVEVDLDFLSEKLENSEYEPEQYFALIHRLKNPKLSILINKSGKVIFTGARSIKDIKKAQSHLIAKLKNLGIEGAKANEIHVQNIVGKAKTGLQFDLGKLPQSNLLDVSYDPDVFPGAIISVPNVDGKVILFKNGSLSFVGFKDFNIIKDTINEIISTITAKS
jgi:transcription initiation factor TFIID TATA-box-binding protein